MRRLLRRWLGVEQLERENRVLSARVIILTTLVESLEQGL